jgi:hypothetical protein
VRRCWHPLSPLPPQTNPDPTTQTPPPPPTPQKTTQQHNTTASAASPTSSSWPHPPLTNPFTPHTQQKRNTQASTHTHTHNTTQSNSARRLYYLLVALTVASTYYYGYLRGNWPLLLLFALSSWLLGAAGHGEENTVCFGFCCWLVLLCMYMYVCVCVFVCGVVGPFVVAPPLRSPRG